MIELIGNTPMISIPHPNARILAKLEWFNPTGSSKDRAAAAMLRAARLSPGAAVVEATSGNTGIALSALCAFLGYRCVIVMPADMSRERQRLMAAYGARVILSPPEEGMAGAVGMAKEMDGFYVNQFENPANPHAHFDTTGPEIWNATGGAVDILVAGIGTGGTISGAGRYLKRQKPSLLAVGVLPSEGGIPGIGAGFLPRTLDPAIPDEILSVHANDAAGEARRLASMGILAGISSGAALWAARRLADRRENRGKTIVAIFPDSGERYLSTGVYGGQPPSAPSKN